MDTFIVIFIQQRKNDTNNKFLMPQTFHKCLLKVVWVISVTNKLSKIQNIPLPNGRCNNTQISIESLIHWKIVSSWQKSTNLVTTCENVEYWKISIYFVLLLNCERLCMCWQKVDCGFFKINIYIWYYKWWKQSKLT